METKKLLQEFFLLERSEKEPGKARKLKGTFQIANKVNQNGRIYPKAILEREIDKFSKLIKSKDYVGAIDMAKEVKPILMEKTDLSKITELSNLLFPGI